MQFQDITFITHMETYPSYIYFPSLDFSAIIHIYPYTIPVLCVSFSHSFSCQPEPPQMSMLRQFMKQWKTITLKCSRRALLSPRRHIPSGFLAVYVGPNRMRFLVPVRILHLPIFVALLQRAEEEYGFKFNGGIILPCEVDFFKQVLRFLDKDEKKYGRLELHEFLKVISEMGFDSSSCKDEEGNFSRSHHDLIPLMQKARVWAQQLKWWVCIIEENWKIMMIIMWSWLKHQCHAMYKCIFLILI